MKPTEAAAQPPPATPTPAMGATRISRAITWAFFAVLSICGAWLFVAYARAVLQSEYNLDDWGWLIAGRHPWQMVTSQLSLRHAFGSQVYRPVFHWMMAGCYLLFGADPRPASLVFLGVHVVANVLTALVLLEIEMPLAAAVLAAVGGFFTDKEFEAFLFFSLHPVHVSRMFMMAAMLALLRRARARVWVPLAIAALLSHEQSVVMAPLVLLCIWYRDGRAGLRRAAGDRDVVAFSALSVGYAAVRFLLRNWSVEEPHSLHLASIPIKLRFFREDTLRYLKLHFWGDLVGLLHRFTPSQLSLTFALVAALPLLLLLLRPARRRRLELLLVARALVLGAGWWIIAYLPFIGAAAAGYHFSLSAYGLAIAIGALMGVLVDPVRPWPLRVPAMALALATAFSLTPSQIRAARASHQAQLHSTPLLAAVRAGLVAPEEDGRTVVFLVEKQAARYSRAAPPRYLLDTGGLVDTDGEAARSLVGVPIGNTALEVTFPDRHFRVCLIDPEGLAYLDPRRGDVLVDVRLDRDLPLDERYSFRVRPPPDGASPLPAALDPATTIGRAVETANVAGQHDDWRQFIDGARSYWEAYARHDHHGAVREGEAVLATEFGQPPAGQTALDAATRIRGAIETTIPVRDPTRDPPPEEDFPW